MGGPRHIRDVIAETPELARYLRDFGGRLSNDEPFTEAELAEARAVLARGRTDRQGELKLKGAA